MNQRLVTILALSAAIVGAIQSVYQGVINIITLAQHNVSVPYLIFQFLASNYWTGYGLIFLFVMILFYPRIQRLGSIGVIIGAVISLFFSIYSIISFIGLPSLGMVGNMKLVISLSPLWALLMLAFGILWAVNPNGWALRISALLVGLGMVTNHLLRGVTSPLFVTPTIQYLVSAVIILWFAVISFRGNAIQDNV